MALTLSGPSHPPQSGGKPTRLVILLHGLGADGNDLIGLAPYWAPLLPDAAHVVKTPGRLEYKTDASVADAAAFYQKQVPSQGWKSSDEPALTDKAAFLNFMRGDQKMIIFISARDGKTNVTITLGTAQQ